MYLSSGGVFLIFVVAGSFILLFGKVVEERIALGVSYRAEDVFLDFFVVLFQSFQKILYILPFGVLVGGAGVVDNRFVFRKTDYFFFGNINHRADNRQAYSFEFRYGRESG